VGWGVGVGWAKFRARFFDFSTCGARRPHICCGREKVVPAAPLQSAPQKSSSGQGFQKRGTNFG
jgi:hypothetical protein